MIIKGNVKLRSDNGTEKSKTETKTQILGILQAIISCCITHMNNKFKTCRVTYPEY